jgi:TRAP-type C4-dicarboxylate transport system permease small subunit
MPQRPLTWLQRLDRDAERWAMLVFYAFCCIVIVQEVVRRFVLSYSSAWGEEAARYAFIYLGWIGAAYAVRERAHIRFDFLLRAVARRTRAWLYLFAELATIVFACIALYWSMHTIQTLLQFGAATRCCASTRPGSRPRCRSASRSSSSAACRRSGATAARSPAAASPSPAKPCSKTRRAA